MWMPNIEADLPTKPIEAPVEVDNIDVADTEYQAMIRKLGIVLAEKPKVDLSLEQVLSSEFIRCYDEKKVDKYLKQHCPIGEKYCWRPLRKLDADILRFSYYGMLTHSYDGRDGLSGINAHGLVCYNWQYDLPVPYPVLVTADNIASKCPKAVFLVAHYAPYQELPPDPFLMVIGPSKKKYIIERWDEPGFRG